MKSKNGYRPTGTFVLKNPSNYFDENVIIKAIDNWSKGIKDNPVPNLATKIKIKQIQIFPVYRLLSSRFYENRTLTTHKEYCSPGKYNRIPELNWKDANAWNYEDKVQSKDYSFNLADSFYSEDCNECRATGETTCRCKKCDGKGRYLETRRDNGHDYETSVPCNECNGSGRYIISCGNCSGHGAFVNYIKCNVKYETISTTEKWSDPRVAQFDNEEANIPLKWELSDFHFLENIKTPKDVLKNIDGDLIQEAAIFLADFIKKSDSSNQRFLKEETLVGQTYASFVNMSYEDGSNFSVLIFGENDKVYAPKSPITNSIETLLKNANEFLINGDFKSAERVINLINGTKVRPESLENFVDKFKSKFSEAVYTFSNQSKHSDLNSCWLKRESAAIYRPELQNDIKEEKRIYSFKIELLAFLLFPIMAFIAASFQLPIFKKSDSLLHIFSCLFLATSLIYACHYYFYEFKSTDQSSSSDMFYKSIWKYFAHSALVYFFPIFMIAGMVSLGIKPFFNKGIGLGLLSFGLYSAAWIAYTIIITKQVLKYLDDSHKQFYSYGVNNFLPDIQKKFQSELAEIKQFLPTKNYSYVDESSKSDDLLKSRKIEEVMNLNSKDDELNFYPQKNNAA